MASFSGLDCYRLNEIHKSKGDVKLGGGAYGTVWELEYMGLKCAGKEIHEILLNQGKDHDTYAIARYAKECQLLSQVRHPNIVQFLGVHFEQGKRLPILVMEFLPMDLTKCIEDYKVVPKEICYSILQDISLGLCYLHSQAPPIIHRDLSSNNILLTSSRTAKIADLGVARILHNLSPMKASKLTNVPGTFAFMPPEVMVEDPKYDTSVDIFSYGMIMIHTSTGKWPNPLTEANRTEKGQLIPVSEAERRKQHLDMMENDQSKNLMLRCINNDPQKRPNAKDVATQISKMASNFPLNCRDPLEMMKILGDIEEDMRATTEKWDAAQKIISQKEDEISKLQQELEQAKLSIAQDKKPLQASIKWKLCSNPPHTVAQAQSTLVKNKIYFGGGDTKSISKVYCYDTFQDEWSTLPSLPTREFGLSHFGNQLVAVGGVKGRKNERTNEVYTLTDTNKWEKKIPPMRTPRNLVAVTEISSSLLVVGGQVRTGKSTNVAEIFKQETSQWYTIIQHYRLPVACFSPSIAVSKDTVYIIGGYDDQQFRLQQTLCAPIDDILLVSEIDEIEGKFAPRWNIQQSTLNYQPATAMLDGNLLSIGGWKTPQTTTTLTKKVYMFCPTKNVWVYVSELPEPIACSAAAAVSPTEVLVIGSTAQKLMVYKGSVSVNINNL